MTDWFSLRSIVGFVVSQRMTPISKNGMKIEKKSLDGDFELHRGAWRRFSALIVNSGLD